MEVIVCTWCRMNNAANALQCVSCGAPLDVKDKVSDSGWREAPRLRDMEEFKFGNSTLQVEGKYVPVADIALQQGDSVYFEQHTMLWKEPGVPLEQYNLPSGRSMRGMPYSVLYAKGPGRIAFSRDAPGELVVMPIHPGMEIDVREHAFLLASHSVTYSFVRIKGLVNLLHGGNGMYLDRFITQAQPGMLMLHGNGDVLQRTLGAGETILVEAGKFLYKDSSVKLETVPVPGVKTGLFSKLYMAQLTGPGRVGIQSMYHHHLSE
ncbi:MAG: AIM24 family protein [Proteobacteria bacterium]|nr:AIM24 family protein [Pseudomonadota bacterium]MBS0464164.1 AIM24 family protein [Pseudomonadota bacterium]